MNLDTQFEARITYRGLLGDVKTVHGTFANQDALKDAIALVGLDNMVSFEITTHPVTH
jgi:hypothetical protein